MGGPLLLSSAIYYLCDLGKILHISVPQFFHLQNGKNINIQII